MALQDPVAVYNAGDAAEAHAVCDLLVERGVAALFTENNSVAGLAGETNSPQVWVERADADRAGPILAEYERGLVEKQRADAENAEPVGVVCDECGQRSEFPASLRGTVQDCPHCGRYVDVGEVGWSDEEIGEPDPEDDG